MSWSIVRELTRVATPDNERAWLDVARGRTVRQIEELVAGRDALGGSARPRYGARDIGSRGRDARRRRVGDRNG